MSDTPKNETEEEETKKFIYLMSAGMLGACVLLLAGMIAIQQLDTPLTVAVIAFAIALPFLTLSTLAFPGDLLLTTDPRRINPVEMSGGIALIVGLSAIFFHFSPLAFFAFMVAGLIAIIILGRWLRRREQEEKQARTQLEKLPPEEARNVGQRVSNRLRSRRKH